MLFTLILLPLIAAIAIFFGAPARKTALIAALLNLAVSIYPLATWSCSCWNTGFQVLENPSISLSLGLSGISAVMLLLSVLVTLASVYSGKCPEGREKLWFSSMLLISAGAIGAFLSTDVFFFYAFHELGCHWSISLDRCLFLLRLPRTCPDPDLPDDWYSWSWRS